VTKRQTLLDAILVCFVSDDRAAQAATALGALALQQVTLASARAQYLAAARDFEPLGHGFLGLNSLRTTHNVQLSFKKSAQYRNRVMVAQAVFLPFWTVQIQCIGKSKLRNAGALGRAC